MLTWVRSFNLSLQKSIEFNELINWCSAEGRGKLVSAIVWGFCFFARQSYLWSESKFCLCLKSIFKFKNHKIWVDYWFNRNSKINMDNHVHYSKTGINVFLIWWTNIFLKAGIIIIINHNFVSIMWTEELAIFCKFSKCHHNCDNFVRIRLGFDSGESNPALSHN